LSTSRNTSSALFGVTEPLVTQIGAQLLRYLSISAFFITVALSYIPAEQQ
jgi:hypothetical protein